MIKDLFIIGCECEVDFMATSIVRYIPSFQKGGDTYQYYPRPLIGQIAEIVCKSYNGP